MKYGRWIVVYFNKLWCRLEWKRLKRNWISWKVFLSFQRCPMISCWGCLMPLKWWVLFFLETNCFNYSKIHLNFLLYFLLQLEDGKSREKNNCLFCLKKRLILPAFALFLRFLFLFGNPLLKFDPFGMCFNVKKDLKNWICYKTSYRWYFDKSTYVSCKAAQNISPI